MAVLYFRNMKGKFVEVPAICGRSAYKIAVANGFEGTEKEWLESLKGAKGAPGTTPVKGVDYWTEEDKAEIIAAVIAQLPNSGGSSGDSGSSGDDDGGGSGVTYYTATVTLDGETLYTCAGPGAAPSLRITVFDSGFHIQNSGGTSTQYTYNYTGSGTFPGVYSGGQLYEPGEYFVRTSSGAGNIQIDLTTATSSDSGGSSGSDDTTIYTTTVTLDGDALYTAAGQGTAPNLRITVFDSGFYIQDNDGATLYTYNYTGSETFLGVYCYGQLYEPGKQCYRITTTKANTYLKLTTATSSDSGGSSGGDTNTYTTTINVDGEDYWTSPTATEDASPEMTIAVYSSSNCLGFTYSYQGSLIGRYPATAGVTAFKYMGIAYIAGRSFTIGGEAGQNTVAKITTISDSTSGDSSDNDSITFTVGGRSYTVPSGTTWTDFVNTSSYWSSNDLTFTVSSTTSGSFIKAVSADYSDAGHVMSNSNLVPASATITATSYDIENAGS